MLLGNFLKNQQLMPNAESGIVGPLPDVALSGDIDLGFVQPWYQPKLDLIHGGMAGVESLARYEPPHGPSSRNGGFVEKIRQSGRLHSMVKKLLRLNARDMLWWRKQGLEMPVSVNAEWAMVETGWLLDQLNEVSKQFDIPLSSFRVEVTEHDSVESIARATRALSDLQGRGVKIALDDFGVDNSSLSVLSEFHFDYIKIDRKFIHGIHADTRNAAIVAGVVNIAGNLGVKVVAEGVENIRDLHALGRIGCHYVQGFLYGKPMKAADVLGFYREESDIRRSAESADYQVE